MARGSAEILLRQRSAQPGTQGPLSTGRFLHGERAASVHSMTCDNADAETPVEPSHHMPH